MKDTVDKKLEDMEIEGFAAEFDPDEAENLCFEENALSPEDASDAALDSEA